MWGPIGYCTVEKLPHLDRRWHRDCSTMGGNRGGGAKYAEHAVRLANLLLLKLLHIVEEQNLESSSSPTPSSTKVHINFALPIIPLPTVIS